MPKGLLLKVLLPLYGIPEAGTHWFHTYHAHYTRELKLQQSSYDPCLLFTTKDSNTDDIAIVGLQTNDTLIASNATFREREHAKLQKAGFLAKPV